MLFILITRVSGQMYLDEYMSLVENDLLFQSNEQVRGGVISGTVGISLLIWVFFFIKKELKELANEKQLGVTPSSGTI